MKTLDPLKIFYKNLNSNSRCLFCKPISGSVLFDTKNFRVMLDTFPLCPGHIMLSTKEHYGSAGEVPIEWFEEFTKLKNEITTWANSKSGFSIFYEHGRAGSCFNLNEENSRCNHFHLHCLPINICIHDKLKEDRYDHEYMLSYDQIQDLFFKYGNYLFFQNSNNKMFFYLTGEKKIPSHLLRTLISNAIGSPNLANWEQYDRSDLYIESYEFTQDLRQYGYLF